MQENENNALEGTNIDVLKKNHEYGKILRADIKQANIAKKNGDYATAYRWYNKAIADAKKCKSEIASIPETATSNNISAVIAGLSSVVDKLTLSGSAMAKNAALYAKDDTYKKTDNWTKKDAILVCDKAIQLLENRLALLKKSAKKASESTSYDTSTFLGQYMALESVKCEDLFNDIVNYAEEGVVDTLRAGARKLVKLIEWLIHKIIDLYRIVDSRKVVVVSAEVGKAYKTVVDDANAISLMYNEVFHSDYNQTTKSRVEVLVTVAKEHIEHFNTLKTNKVSDADKSRFNKKRFSGTTMYIKDLKTYLSFQERTLNTIKKTILKSNPDSIKTDVYHKLVALIAGGISCTNKILYHPVQTQNNRFF